ncbi:DinB family protein [Streptomyces lonarensis]|uniref:DUF664 domain-containing protein n=1 Tax=Streptomyces lonarensis TaxID=700599 RepID=A0A7X6HYN7_9ACTN|nr:DUF664 domain-containing protein [Streptomyces lonarensis]
MPPPPNPPPTENPGGDEARTPPPLTDDERTMLRGFLDGQRATLLRKCAGLSDDQLRARPVAPSALTLLGLLRHLAEVERAWFRRVFEDNGLPLVWSDRTDFQAAYDASRSTHAEALAAWEAEVAHSRRIERAAASLDVTGVQPRTGQTVSLRLSTVHVLTEYARHNGHADLLREATDGATGA